MKEIKRWRDEKIRGKKWNRGSWPRLIALYFRHGRAICFLVFAWQTFIFALVKPSLHSFPPSRVSFFYDTTRKLVALSAPSFNHRWPSLVSRASTFKSFPRSWNLFDLLSFQYFRAELWNGAMRYFYLMIQNREFVPSLHALLTFYLFYL